MKKNTIVFSARTAGVLCVLFSAVIFGFTPVLAAISYRGGNNGINMTFLRALLPLPILFLMAKRTAPSLRLTRGQAKTSVLLGLLLFGCTLMLYSSYAYIPVGVATTLHFLYPLYVALYGALFKKQRLDARRVVGLALGLVGAMLFLDTTGQALDVRGLVLALLSGMCYAAYIIVLGREATQPLPLYQLMLYISLTGVCLSRAVGLALGRLTFQLTPSAWVCAVLVAMLVSVVSCVLFQKGVRLIGEANAAIFSLLEPLTSILFSILLLGDTLPPIKALGCALILGGLFVTALRKRA